MAEEEGDLGTHLLQEEGEGKKVQQQQQEDEEQQDSSGYQQQVQILKESMARLSHVFQAERTAKRWHRAVSRSSERRAPWRKKLGGSLDSTACHIFVVVLLLVDLLATAVDILKTMHNDTTDLHTCTTFLEACYCVSSFETSKPWEFLHWISVSILSVLLLNVAGLLVAFGGSFFLHPGYVLDLVVVGTAFSFELFLNSDTAGLLIILNLWRIVRVAHGIFEVTDEAWEKEMQKLEDQVRLVEQAYERDQEILNRKDQEILQLKRQLKSSDDNTFV
ncbi:hypothetical protein O6H91_13G009800 [Diphasiastrum complanatum]|uniref:Uncharacterized protein n=1 Tax=Diphasiastrum complanatum TaxID=34168 RepID=A0ACC2BSD6_DIPCM|nr:hypothetical protein O6H91_13G009800 [Diphasiastrum complanatum]